MDDALIDEEQAEQTIVLKRISSPPAALERHSPVMTPGEASPSQSPSPSLSSSPQLTETPVHKRSKLKVTTELERIVSKIWVIVGELIMPGHPFDVTDAGTSKKRPPRAKETIAYLEELSARPLQPSSPTASSLSSFSLSSAPPASTTVHLIHGVPASLTVVVATHPRNDARQTEGGAYSEDGLYRHCGGWNGRDEANMGALPSGF
ncbi:hypothetical protein A0H81_13479 [Grifola frondosa]|uniref:Uncharacterized protein n=1 Tax=Grifola frondosa TaxID=5627 RepID=A0A1C7LP64_GRIFR|nr:hypothetical protein A0H81_13479 [Grifola frondosa]